MKRFANIQQFQKYLYERTAALASAEAKALDKVGALVAADAKARIGEYQDEAGPFPGWRDLADSTLADKARKGFAVPNPLERTGEMRDSIEFSRAPERVTIGSPEKTALWQELGTGGPAPGPDGYHVPPRPFLGPALFVNAEEAAKICGEEVAVWLAGGVRPNQW
ncbi:MAG TPA: hypothetical protein VMH92_05895 [Acidocella sp.]|nr:hypothetical protein [Acidocella sp.]